MSPPVPSSELSHRVLAVRTIMLAVSLDVLLGIAFGLANHIGVWRGLYFATVTATTVGYGDIIPVGWLPHILAVLIMVTVIPLFGATFSLFTSGLTAVHVRSSEQRIKQHVEERISKVKHDANDC